MDESAIGRGRGITVAKPVTPTEFIREMEGCVKEGSPIPKIDPLRLKRIWEKHDLHGRHPYGRRGEKVKRGKQGLERCIKTPPSDRERRGDVRW